MKKLISKFLTIHLWWTVLLSVAVISVNFINTDADVNNNSLVKRSELAKIISEKKSAYTFKDVDLFSVASQPNKEEYSDFVSRAVFLNIESDKLNKFLSNAEENITLKIPIAENYTVELELTRISIFSKGFSLVALNGSSKTVVPYKEGVYYYGIIKGNDNSTASVSLFDNSVMGIISDERGNYVLGAMKGNEKQYILYNDNDIKVKNNFVCGVDEKGEEKLTVQKPDNSGNNVVLNSLSEDTVDNYFETDYRLYLNYGSDINLVGNYVTGLFAQVATLYRNESIPFKISKIYVWTGMDPYSNDTDSYDILLKFGNNTKDNFMGDLAHLLAGNDVGRGLGGIAWLRVLCAPFNPQDYSGRFAFSNISASYKIFPIYSWTVMVVTHEIGHNMGSRHTHACWWPLPGGGIGPLDTCVVTGENQSCVSVSRPAIGTIMSYCHFWQNQPPYGINFNLGFGPLPGDTVRLRFSQASCIQNQYNSSEVPIDFILSQNYPNPFNPTTNIKFMLPSEGFVTLRVYDVTGQIVALLIDNSFYSSGIYNYTFDAGFYKLSSGVYFYRIDVERENKSVYSEIKKMVLVK